MRSVPVMEADVDPDELEVLEYEASRAGVPLEFYFIEGWRAALFRGLRELEAYRKDRQAAEVARFHADMDDREAGIVERYRNNLRQHHKRVSVEVRGGVGKARTAPAGQRAERAAAGSRH